jgi:hypothetical protein
MASSFHVTRQVTDVNLKRDREGTRLRDPGAFLQERKCVKMHMETLRTRHRDQAPRDLQGTKVQAHQVERQGEPVNLKPAGLSGVGARGSI